jgi:hypothetical protein
MQNIPNTKRWRCAYCGQSSADRTMDHVVPDGLYDVLPTNKQVLTVRACKKCNGLWSKDETAFRNALAITTYSPETAAIFEKIMRSITQARYAQPEQERLRRMCIRTPDGKGLKIYPGGVVGGGEGPTADSGVLRVVRKIVRGYHFAKGLRWPVPDEEVDAFINPASFPPLPLAHYDHQNPAVFEIWWETSHPDVLEYESGWRLRFYGTVEFLALVKRAKPNFGQN